MSELKIEQDPVDPKEIDIAPVGITTAQILAFLQNSNANLRGIAEIERELAISKTSLGDQHRAQGASFVDKDGLVIFAKENDFVELVVKTTIKKITKDVVDREIVNDTDGNPTHDTDGNVVYKDKLLGDGQISIHKVYEFVETTSVDWILSGSDSDKTSDSKAKPKENGKKPRAKSKFKGLPTFSAIQKALDPTVKNTVGAEAFLKSLDLTLENTAGDILTAIQSKCRDANVTKVDGKLLSEFTVKLVE